MVTRRKSSPPDPDQPAAWGGVLTDDGGRPITDDGGRTVYTSPTDDGEPYALDAQGTPPIGEPTATGTDNPPAETGAQPEAVVVDDPPPAGDSGS